MIYMMEQHPIPQQISSYQFKLVGDMTLKQFFQIAGGVLIGLLFYSTPLHPLIKWPIILFFVLLGVALAFLPLEERPLERWIIAFFRSIYSPTLYLWKKTDKQISFFTEDTSVNSPTLSNTVQTDVNSKKLEETEKDFLAKIGSLWNISHTSQQQNSTNQPINTTMPSNVNATIATPATNEPGTQSTPPSLPKPVDVPVNNPTVVTKVAPRLVVEEAVKPKNVVVEEKINLKPIENKPITTNLAEFSLDAAPPAPPESANTVVGQIIDQDRKIIEGAIMEIRDENGKPVRALKSNKAGHFIIVTPLFNGKYEISTEKDGYKFEPVSFEAKGEIIPPIAVKGTKLV